MSRFPVKVGIIGGTGLDNPDILENRIERNVDTPFGKPSDALIEGKIQGVDCVLLARHGRNHDVSPTNVNYRANIHALREVGCTHIIATTATGSLQESMHPGDLVLLDSFIDRTKHRVDTFYDGKPMSPVGICHTPMEPAFCPETRQVVLKAANDLGISIHPSGTCVCIEGPRFSTLAESKLYRSWGCHLVNMTICPEVVLAKEAGICYASIAVVTDYDCWQERGSKVCVEEVMETFKKNVGKLVKLLTHTIPLVASQDWDDTIGNLRKFMETNVMLPYAAST